MKELVIDGSSLTIEQVALVANQASPLKVKIKKEKITVEYQNLKGENCTMEADDLMAICIQHENDHLEGIVFLDRLSQLKKQFYFKKLQKRKKVYG